MGRGLQDTTSRQEMLSPFKRALRNVPGFLPGTRSLQRHLLTWLLLPQLVLWLAAAFVTYNVAERYANKAIDESLTTATRALARQVKPLGNGLFIDFPKAAQDIIEADPDDRVYYMVSTPPGQFILGNKQLPGPPPIVNPRLAEPYFYDGKIGEGPIAVAVRVSALYLAYGDDSKQRMLVQIARSRASREQLAGEILVDTALPLSALIALMSVIVYGGIRTGLAPLSRMRMLVEGRAPNDLTPIELDAAPEEVRALAKAINTLLAEVQESVSAQKRFISDAAHQLRTPLAGLKSQTELALNETSEPDLKARLQLVNQSAARSAHLVNQLLSLARAEPGSAAEQGKARCDIRKLAADLCAELVPRAIAAGIDLGFGFGDGEDSPDAPAAYVMGHSLLLREALTNLIDNAIRYAGRGKVVTVGVETQGSQVVVTVEDNGPGLAEADRERVFQRFVRATYDSHGCGLGLAIAREIVSRHAGTVMLEAAKPQGLRAVIRLPRA